MKTFNSDKVVINKTAREIFNFLADFNHFERLMPEQVINWNSDSETCRFTIKGMADLGLKFGEKVQFESIQMIANGKVPFNFDIVSNFLERGNNTEVHVRLNANLNPMLSMMASKPLQNFVNILVHKLKEEMEA